jgi:hypothetical protein
MTNAGSYHHAMSRCELKRERVTMTWQQIIGRLEIGAALVALLAACGTEGNARGVGGVPTTVVGATGDR